MEKYYKIDKNEILNLINNSSPFSVIEAYKTLRVNIQFVCPHDGCKVICITSSVAHAGKTTTTLNLAYTFSQNKQKVLVIDSDLRASHITRDLNLVERKGLSTILSSSECNLSNVVQRVDDYLDIIVAGKNPPNPSELLGSERMAHLIEEAKKNYDYILIDSAPVSVVSDALVFKDYIDGYVLVVRSGYSTQKLIKLAVNSIEKIGGKVLGFILNGVKIKDSIYGSYGHYGQYDKNR